MSPLNSHVRSDGATTTRTRALLRTDKVSGITNVYLVDTSMSCNFPVTVMHSYFFQF